MSDDIGFERWIQTYDHGGKVGAMVEIAFDDVFSAKTPVFRDFARDIAMQVAAMAPASGEALLQQDCIRQPDIKVVDQLREVSARLGDRIAIVRFERWSAEPARGAPQPDDDPPRGPANVKRVIAG